MTRIVIPITVALTMLLFGGCAADTVVTVVVTATPGPDPTPIIQTVVVPATPQIRVVVATPTPGPTAPPLIQIVVVTATPEPTNPPAPTIESMTGGSMAGMPPESPEVQEIGLIENYAANRYFPRNIVVVKNIPVRIFLTRLHREHINKFTIAPFYSSSEVILPGEVGVIEFVPDQVGEFKIRNVGHGNEADLIVVETQQEAREYIKGRGSQMYALIHSVDDFRMYPETLVVQAGIPDGELIVN